MKYRIGLCAIALFGVPLASTVVADVFNLPAGQTSLQFVNVGDPGNAADTRLMTDGTTGYGSVSYNFQMGKFEVTSAQYSAFLNSVARTSDTYGLYNSSMAPNAANTHAGITLTNVGGVLTYTAAAGFENHPVNFVSWGDAARFANWLTNGQPNTGVENASTTERGSYTLDGKTSGAALYTITRDTGAKYVIPSENEWYKAAFYKGGGTNAGYWLYTTQSNSAPSNVLNPLGTNNANFHSGPSDGNESDPGNHLTDAGFLAASPGPYGTFDQGGNVFEWNEAALNGGRGRRGGSLGTQLITEGANYRGDWFAADFQFYDFGFRVALVPEPASLFLLAAGASVVLRRRRQR